MPVASVTFRVGSVLFAVDSTERSSDREAAEEVVALLQTQLAELSLAEQPFVLVDDLRHLTTTVEPTGGSAPAVSSESSSASWSERVAYARSVGLEARSVVTVEGFFPGGAGRPSDKNPKFFVVVRDKHGEVYHPPRAFSSRSAVHDLVFEINPNAGRQLRVQAPGCLWYAFASKTEVEAFASGYGESPRWMSRPLR